MWKVDGFGFRGLNFVDGGWFEVFWNLFLEWVLVFELDLYFVN